MNSMRAAYFKGNKRFSLEDVPLPEPSGNEVRVKVAFCGICGTDLHVFHGAMAERIGNHRVIGHESSGVIDAVGSDVKDLHVGDRVVIRPLDACGECPACQRGHKHICHNLKFLGLDTDGAYQEQWVVPAHTIHHIPESVSLSHAALIEPLAVACHDVRRSRLSIGEDVLVIGGGPIGLMVSTVAKAAGGDVTISEVNKTRLETAKNLGFKTLNPIKTDVAVAINKATGNKGADVIFEVSGTQEGVDTMTAAASARCRIVMVAIHSKAPQVDMFQFFWREIELLGARVYEPEDYDQAIQLIAAGVVDCEKMITDVRDLAQIDEAFQALGKNPEAVKSLIKCS
jgi:2-desacetyl-2-hydroxyethyl bacteriochlorophyllide A dehydrogenase